MIRTYRTLPPLITGYPLDDVWSVLVPVARTNLVTNPSFETATTSWTAIGGSIARSTTYQYHGAYSLAITPTSATTDGARFDTVSLTSGTTYAYSAKVRGVGGLKYKLCLETTGGVELAAITFTASGRWQWIYGYYVETSSTTRRLTLRKASHASTAVFYLDGAQVEAIATGETVSTYIDGDQLGHVPNQSPPAYYWNGTPHAATSTRSGLTRAGGMVVPFRKYGFLLTAIVGLGLAVPQNVATEYARIDGGYDDYTRKPTRQFSLAGRFQGATYGQLRDQRGRLARLFDRDLIGQDQRLTLLRHVEDERGQIVSSTARITAKYESGLGGNTDNQVAESAAITFTQYLPLIGSDNEVGASLNVQTSVSNANAILQRSATGVWTALSTGMSGGTTQIRALARGVDGTLYAGGDFTDAGGSGADYLAKWNGSAWSVLGSATAINGVVACLAIGPDGALYAGGYFSNAGGVAAADGIAKWDGSTWTALGTGASAGTGVNALAFGPDGTLYAGGDFSSMGGVANTNGIAKWNGSAWSAMGSGAAVGAAVYALATRGTTVYAGGNFTGMGGVANTEDIAKWDGSAWSSLGAGTTGPIVYALAVAPDGQLYIGGNFTSIGGQAISYLARWNGVSYASIGTLNNFVLYGGLLFDSAGTLHIGGTFTTVNGVTYPNGAARLIGGNVFATEDVILPGAAVMYTSLPLSDGTLSFGFQGTGTATSAATTTITNTGTAKTYPVLTIKGPSSGTSRIYQIVNYTTNRAVYFNYTINAGETARLVFQPDALSFTSDFVGNIANTILPGSTAADFFLQPGSNIISFFSASSTVTATLYWRPQFASLDDVQ